ncbi:MAG: hypothetical protein PVJ06_14120 [Desulfobacterales bacterium]
MTLNNKISNPVKIKVPYILDDPVVGRTIPPVPFTLFHDYILIENGKLTYEGSRISTQQKKSFHLKDIAKLLLKTKTISCWTKEHKLNYSERSGKRMELYLVDTKNHEHLLIPGFYLDAGEKRWNRFISELCKFSELPLEEMNESEDNSD